MAVNYPIPKEGAEAFNKALAAFYAWTVEGERDSRAEPIIVQRCSIGAVCDLIAVFDDPMPENVYQLLTWLAAEHSVAAPADRSFASGAKCLSAAGSAPLARGHEPATRSLIPTMGTHLRGRLLQMSQNRSQQLNEHPVGSGQARAATQAGDRRKSVTSRSWRGSTPSRPSRRLPRSWAPRSQPQRGLGPPRRCCIARGKRRRAPLFSLTISKLTGTQSCPSSHWRISPNASASFRRLRRTSTSRIVGPHSRRRAPFPIHKRQSVSDRSTVCRRAARWMNNDVSTPGQHRPSWLQRQPP
jgi:hypothetical protein